MVGAESGLPDANGPLGEPEGFRVRVLAVAPQGFDAQVQRRGHLQGVGPIGPLYLRDQRGGSGLRIGIAALLEQLTDRLKIRVVGSGSAES